MQHNPALVADTRAWLTKALMDSALPNTYCRLCRRFWQAAEKALKGYLAWHDEPFRKTHNLEELGRQAVDLDPELQPLVDRASGLTKYAWKYRYPGEPEEPERQEAADALALAREVYEAILSRLPEEVRP